MSNHPSIEVAVDTELLGRREHATRVPASEAESMATDAEGKERAGKRMIFAGFAITILGVVLYCAVHFAAGSDATAGDVLVRNTVPLADATLVMLGVGTLVWLIGSFLYLNGAMDSSEPSSPDTKR